MDSFGRQMVGDWEDKLSVGNKVTGVWFCLPGWVVILFTSKQGPLI